MRWKPDQSTSDFLFEISDDRLYQLSCVAQEVLDFPESQWPAGVTASKETNDLFAILRPITKGGGRIATIDELKRIEELVESILDGKPIEEKEPTKNKVGRPRIGLSYEGFADALKEDTRRKYWTQTQWATHFKCSHQTIGRNDGWKKIQNMWTKESRSVVLADNLDGP